MCNRFRSIHAKENAPRAIRDSWRLNFEPNPNVAPSEVVPIVIALPGEPPVWELCRFGITMPPRGGKPGFPLTNARLDKMRAGRYRTALAERRCVIPAVGFYEFREDEAKQPKQPYYFSRADGEAIMLAGIWQVAEYKGDRRQAFAIVTDEPNPLIAAYHDRMPYALTDEAAAAWLDLGNAAPLDAMRPIDLDAWTVRPMNKAMNKTTVKDLALIDPAAS